jgi:uncharacterized protein YgfB (UPF0149 family)
MQTQAKSPVFDDFYHLLTQAEVATSPAEIHGMFDRYFIKASWD